MEHGAGVPAIDTSGSGSACTTSEATINLTSLAAGAKDIYIKVKDNAGNVSDALEIDIAQYIPPAATPTGSVIINNGTIKKNAEITMSSEDGATIYYTTALNDVTPDEPTTLTPAQVSNGGVITLPALAFGDILKIKAIAVVPGKPDSAVANLSYTVQSKTALTLTGIILSDKEYDGNTDAAADFTGVGLLGAIETDSVYLTGTPSASFLTAAAANGKTVTVSGYSIAGIDAEYYTLNTTLTSTANITARTVSVDSVTIANKAYDGTTAATITGAALAGKVEGDDVTIDYTATSAAAAFEDASAGNGKQVFVTGLVLGGSDKANYVLSSGNFTTTGNIAELGTVTTPAADIADNTVIKSGETVTLTTEGNAGATLYYTVGLAPENPASADDCIGSGGTVTITGNPGDEVILKVYGAEAGYADSSIATFHYTIQPKSTLTVTGAMAACKEYDGTTTAEVTGGTLEGSILTGDDVTLVANMVTGQFANKNAGTDKIVTVSGYTLEGADAMYYDLLQPTLTADIQKKDIAVSSIAINDKVYDGSKAATIESITLNWKAAGDDVYVQIPAAAAVFSDVNIGKDKIVSVTGLELGGADAGNYRLISATASATGNIVSIGTVATPTASPTEESILSGTNVVLTTATSGAAIYYTLDGSAPTNSSKIYNGSIIITGNPGTVITVKAIAEKTGMTDSGIMTKQYTIVEPGSLIITTVPADRMIALSWNGIPDTVTYAVYSGDDYLGNGISVTDSVYGYNATGLTNGILYTFTVNALDSEQRVTNSAQTSGIPRTVPAAPTGVTAEAGNRHAIISFTEPTDNGGSEITGYIVTASPGNITVYGANSPITVTGLTNGRTYTFTVKAVSAVGDGIESEASNRVIPEKPSRERDPDETDTTTTTTPPAPTDETNPAETGVEVLVNGKTETAATESTMEAKGKTVVTITLDDKKIDEKLQNEANNAVVTIPFNSEAEVANCQLNGQTVKNMEIKEAVLEIKAEDVSYTLPASEINIDSISEQIGEQVGLKDIAVNVKISKANADIAKIVEDTANKGRYQVVVKPVEFEITCTNNNKTVEVSKFNSYVERKVAIPEGVDAARITTGIVLNADGTFSHVPTAITTIDGKYYAKINSLTNSTYSVIYSPKVFKDVENHSSKEAVNDMGSRLVISGVGEDRFEPDRDITRAEFAVIAVRALGLMRPDMGKAAFSDVNKADWYYDAVSIAYEYGLISGYGSGKFGPDDAITREQAMTIIARAMNITGLKTDLTNGEDEILLAGFKDTDKSAEYVRDSIKDGIISVRDGKLLVPKDNITRAEAAVIIRRLLQISDLI